MSISTCPRCREEVRVPTGAIPADAYAQCPWCHETFPVSDVLESLPPPIQIISADGTPLAVGESPGAGLELVETSKHQAASDVIVHETVENAFQPADGGPATTDEGTWQPDFGEFQSSSGGSAASNDDPYTTWDAADSSPIQSMNVSTGNSRPRRKTSGLGTAIGIVLGGLASVPIAGALLMLLGRTPDWGFWPFTGESDSTSVQAAPLRESSMRPPSPMSTAPTSSGTPLRFNRDQPGDDPSASATQEIMNTSLNDSESEQAENASPLQSTAELATENGNTDSSVDTSAALTARGETAGSAGSDDESSAAASKAARMIDVMSQNQELDPAEWQRRMAMTYQNIATEAGQSDASAAQSLEALAAKIVASPLVGEIESAGWEWLGSQDTVTSGIALIGRTKDADQGASAPGPMLTADSGESVLLQSDVDIPADQRVLILGRRLDPKGAVKVIVVQPLP